MSLPPCILYLDADKKILAKEFVNVGWFFTGNALARTIIESVIDNKISFDRCQYVYLYGYMFDKEFITSSKDLKDFTLKGEEYLDVTPYKEFKEHEINEELKKMIKFNKKSWHYYIAREYGNYYPSGDNSNANICAYTRAVLMGLFGILFVVGVVLFLVASFGIFAHWGITGILNGWEFLQPKDVGGLFVVFSIALWFTVGLCLVLIGISVLVAKGVSNSSGPLNFKDSFIVNAWKSFHGKFCSPITFYTDEK